MNKITQHKNNNNKYNDKNNNHYNDNHSLHILQYMTTSTINNFFINITITITII